MQVNSFNVRAANIGFKGINEPKTSAEKMESITRRFFRNAYVEGQQNASCQRPSTIASSSRGMRYNIAELIKTDGGNMTCKEFAEKLEEPVTNDID